MKISKKSQQIAKQIFLVSQDSGKTNETKIIRFTNFLAKEGSSKAKEILESLEKLVEREQKNRELILESVYPLTKEYKNRIQNYFEKKVRINLELEEIENKALISGLKIKLADNVWENTIWSNLQKLKGTINS